MKSRKSMGRLLCPVSLNSRKPNVWACMSLYVWQLRSGDHIIQLLDYGVTIFYHFPVFQSQETDGTYTAQSGNRRYAELMENLVYKLIWTATVFEQCMFCLPAESLLTCWYIDTTHIFASNYLCIAVNDTLLTAGMWWGHHHAARCQHVMRSSPRCSLSACDEGETQARAENWLHAR